MARSSAAIADTQTVIVYGWKKASRLKVDAQKVGQRMATLHRKHGHLTAELVLKDAAAAASPQHNAFVWDDTEAAHEFRLEQARHMLRAIVVIRDNGQKDHPIRAFVQLMDKEDESVYMDLNVVMGDAAMRQQVVKRAWRELEVWRDRYHEYEELASIFEAMARAQYGKERE